MRTTALLPDSWPQELDAASEELLKAAREVYKTFFKEFKDLPTAKCKVEHWDAGWWQTKRCLVEAGLESERQEQIEEIKKQLGVEVNQGALDFGIITSA